MNNKELNAIVALKMNIPKAETKYLTEAFAESVKSLLTEEVVIDFDSFGKFEINKVAGHEVIELETQEQKLLPPKLVVQFEQSQVLKEKLNLNAK